MDARGGIAVVLILSNAACAGLPVGAPPTESVLSVQTVTYACIPLRAEFTVEGVAYVRGLFAIPDCPTPERRTADCYLPPADHQPCPLSCPQLTYWKSLGGTAPMHRFSFPLSDDGTNSGTLTATVHLKLSTLDGTLIWEGDQSEKLEPLLDHRAGYFHRGLMEIRLDSTVFHVLGRNCLDAIDR